MGDAPESLASLAQHLRRMADKEPMDMIDEDRLMRAADLIDARRADLPASVRVKPGAIERIVWSAMVWAHRSKPGPDEVPEYTDGGNSFAEAECRAAVRRILAALEPTPSPVSDPRVVALVEALRLMIWYAEAVEEDGCPKCGGDCASCNPKPTYCPMRKVASDLTLARNALDAAKETP